MVLVVDPFVGGALISAGAGLVNGVANLFSRNKANKQNIALQRETNALNYKMFQEGNEFNRQMAFDMFDAENAYNTPAAQAARLREANLNPALVAEGATATTGNGDIATPQAVSSSPMVAPQVMPVGSPFQDVFDNVEKIASAFQKVNSGNLNNAQKHFVLEQAKSERLKQIGLDFANRLQQAYGMQEADARVKNLFKDLEKKDQEISTLVTAGKLNEAEAALKAVQEIAEKNKNKIFDSTFDYLVQQEQEKVNLLRAQTADEKASAAEHYAGRDLKKAEEAHTEELRSQLVAMRDDNIAINKALRNEKELNNGKLAYTLESQVELLKNEKLISDENIKMIHELAEKAQKENSSYYWRMAFDMIERTAKAAAAMRGFSLSSPGSSNMYTPLWSTTSTQ